MLPMISVQEYRNILNDHVTTDEMIRDRISYLEALCRNVIQSEIKNHVKGTKNKIK